MAVTLLLAFSQSLAAADIEGRWETTDLNTGEPRGVVTFQFVGDVLEGRISGGKPRAGENADSVCVHCEGALKNQRLLGMRVVWDMRADGDARHFSGGRVLDPDSGTIYRAKLTLSEDGSRLDVRGYIGLPAFGQTTTWKRLPADAPALLP